VRHSLLQQIAVHQEVKMSTQRVRNVRSAQIRRLAVSLLSATRVQRGINVNHNETVLRAVRVG
jgi:hypothetical protein